MIQSTEVDNPLQNLPSFLTDFSSFEEHLQMMFLRNDSENDLTVLWFIEFNNLSDINDIFDFQAKNEIETTCIEQLLLLLGRGDLLTKMDQDQYLIARNISANDDPRVLAKHILHILSEPFMINEQMFYLQASIGIGLYPFNGDTTHKLINAAKKAMLSAKKNGANHIELINKEELRSTQEKNLQLMRDLPAAIENSEIYFHYQPQYSYETKSFVGAEILARWDHPKYGNISPELFISVAEKSGMIGPLTIKTLVDASKAFTILEESGFSTFSLSINISPLFLTSSSFIPTLEFIYNQYALENRILCFEITEEAIMINSEHLLGTLKQLKDLNIKIELDDFGTGHTSLQHLANLPLDTLKVDKSFISDIDKEEKKRIILKAIVEMTKALNIDLIVEGVENSEEDRIVQDYQYLKVQGYFYSKPIEFSSLLTLLKASNP